MNTQKTVTAANAAQSIDSVLWMLMYTATEGAGRVQGIRGHFGAPACFAAVYLPPLCQYSCRPLRRQLDEVQQEFQKWYSEKGATA